MSERFDHIAIIFNPQSTGDAPRLAKNLARDLKKRGFIAKLEPTQRAGHASALARRISLKYARPLIISVSGDGGYNEVINGTMAAKDQSSQARPVVSVLGAGNANDHYRVMHDQPIVELVTAGRVQTIDLIAISAQAPKFQLHRYAHSYIGFGITPEVGDQLNRHGKDLLSEIILVSKTFMKFQPFTIVHAGQRRVCDSLLFANINEMAKFVKLDDKNSIYDDSFKMIEFRHYGKLVLLWNLLKAAVIGLTKRPAFRKYQFTVTEELPVQSDGEIDQLPAGTEVTITSHHAAIDSLH